MRTKLAPPLNTTNGHLQLLYEDLRRAGDKAGAERVAVVLEQLDRVAKIVRGGLSRGGWPEPRALATDLHTLAAGMLKFIEPSLASARVSATLMAAGRNGSAMARTDPDLTDQIVLNLLKNAIEALAPGGKITLTTGRDGTTAFLEIADDGPGLSPDARSQLFQPFVTSKGAAGTGLGLAVSRRLARALGGRAGAAAVRKGDTMETDFAYAGAVMSAVRKPVRLLLVDDDEEACRMLGEVLERESYEVHRGLSVKDGLALFDREGPFDAVLTDLRMPEASGLDLLAAVRERDPEVLVLVLTAFGDAAAAGEAIRAGAYDFISKPYDLVELRSTLGRALERRKLAGARQERGPTPPTGGAAIARGLLVGHSPGIIGVMKQVARVASTQASVLIFGETGTGKELVARHHSSILGTGRSTDGIGELFPRWPRGCWRVSCSVT